MKSRHRAADTGSSPAETPRRESQHGSDEAHRNRYLMWLVRALAPPARTELRVDESARRLDFGVARARF